MRLTLEVEGLGLSLGWGALGQEEVEGFLARRI